MLFTFLVVAAAPQALGLRPSATSSATSAQFAKLLDFAKAARSDPSNDPTTALQEVASVVNSIMIQEGNATDHLTAEDQTLLNDVIAVIRDSMYASMTTAHVSDEGALAAAIAAINQCYMDFAARAADDLAVMESSVRTHQTTLNDLQDDVDSKTTANATAWSNLVTHISLISDAPACPALPNPRTMPSLDVYFGESAYVVWFVAQKAAYEPIRDAYLEANRQLEQALTAYAVGLAVRNVAYCDWKRELEAACAQFSACYEAAKAHYLNVVKPAVEAAMNMRIEAYKAGETIIHQIRFLLAEEANQAGPAINTDVYQIAFPEVPAKPSCDMSALDDAAWVPTPDCHDEQQLVNGCSTNRIYAQYGAERMEGGNQVAGEAVCCDEAGRCTRHIRNDEAWFLTSLSHEHCTTDSTGVIVENQTPPSHSYHQAKAMCRSVGWRLPKTQAEVDSTCGTGCHIDATLVWIEPDHLCLSAGAAVDVSGAHDFRITARINTQAAAGTIFGKAFQHGLWRNGNPTGQGKMLFLRGGKLCFDIGWVGVVCGSTVLNDGNDHEVGVEFADGRYHVLVAGVREGSGLQAVADHPETTLSIGKAIGHHVSGTHANGDMAPDFVGTIEELCFA